MPSAMVFMSVRHALHSYLHTSQSPPQGRFGRCVFAFAAVRHLQADRSQGGPSARRRVEADQHLESRMRLLAPTLSVRVSETSGDIHTKDGWMAWRKYRPCQCVYMRVCTCYVFLCVSNPETAIPFDSLSAVMPTSSWSTETYTRLKLQHSQF